MLERFQNVEFCRANDIDVELKVLENSNIWYTYSRYLYSKYDKLLLI